MTDDTKPALTWDEWQEAINWKTGRAINLHDGNGPHAIAALALYGQPFGFTHDDLQFLRDMAAYWQKTGGFGPAIGGVQYRRQDAVEASTSLAHRIAALLPPETPDSERRMSD
jgi:hypothetical protein